MRNIILILTAFLMSWSNAQALEVGDIYYSDKTTSKDLNSSKLPIGLVYWVNDAKDYALVMALPQPADMNQVTAKAQCDNYEPLGTAKGDWHLPNLIEAMRMVSQKWNGIADNKFSTLNTKLAKVTTGQALKNSYYWTTAYQYKWKVNPSTGDFSYDGTTSNNRSVRCVTIIKK